MFVSDIMSSPVIVAHPQDNLARIRNLMLRNKISRVVIVQDERPVGIITRTDIAKRMAEFSRRVKSLDEVAVNEVMSSPVYVVGLRETIRDAAKEMLKHNVSGLPVVDPLGYLVAVSYTHLTLPTN